MKKLIVVVAAIAACSSAFGEAPTEKVLQKYNITTSDDRQFIWFRVAKVGTRSILQILRNNTKLSTDHYGVYFNPKDHPDYFKFAFVRNPWDRVVSAYCSKIATRKHRPFKECFGKSFEFFVNYINRQDLKKADAHIMLQTKLVPLQALDFIGRMESFDEDLRAVLFVIGLENVAIPHKNTSDHAHYTHYYTEHTKNIIGKKYQADIQAFGYTFGDSAT